MSQSTQRAYQEVLDWLEKELRKGSIAIGDKLPGERALAEQFELSRASVREAIRILTSMGLVRTGTGSGPHSGAIVISETIRRTLLGHSHAPQRPITPA